MDIKIGKFNRIRLAVRDYNTLQNDGVISEEFKISDAVQIIVIISVESGLLASVFKSVGNNLYFILSHEDFNKMKNKDVRKLGVNVGDYRLQLDLWI